MRHEIRDSNSLHFTMEVIVGGTPTLGLTPKIRVYSIENDEYWAFSGSSVGTWVASSSYAANPSDFEGDMSELESDGIPGVYHRDVGTGGDDVFNTAPSDNADEGYIVRMQESLSGLLEYVYVVISDVMVSSTSFSGTIDANVVEWDGSGVSGSGGIPDVNVVDWNSLSPTFAKGSVTNLPVISVGGWRDGTSNLDILTFHSSGLPNINVDDWGATSAVLSSSAGGDSLSFPNINVTAWRDYTVSTSGSVNKLPNINVHAWGDSLDAIQTSNPGADTTTGALPAITVEGWGGNTDALFTVGGTSAVPEISVRAWNTSDGNASHADAYVQTSAGGTAVSGDSLPMISVGGWGGDSDASFTVGNTSAVPEISVKAWNTTNNAYTPTSADAFVFSAPGGSEYDHSVDTVLLPAITVKGWAGVVDAAVSVGQTFKHPRITVKSWEGSWTNVTNESDPTSEDIAVTWTKDYMTEEDGSTGSSPVDLPNIRTQVIRNNAIDENAIQVDSVTYEEISATAAQEISDAVWNADIFNTIYNPHTGTAAPPNTNTMAEAMIIRYLSENMNHWTGGVTPVGTPVHTCNNADPNGQKFYSNRLLAHPLTEAEMISYVDRSVVVIKGFDFGTMSFDENTQNYLGRIVSVGAEEGSGTQYFEIKLVNEDESSVPSPGLEASDVLIVKAETDSTMHEIAHEVWEEEVADHETKHTFGMFNRIIAGLAQYNHRITDSTYDETGRLLACRLVVYASAEAAALQLPDTALTTVVVTSEYDEKQNMTTFLSKEEGAYADVDPDPEDSSH